MADLFHNARDEVLPIPRRGPVEPERRNWLQRGFDFVTGSGRTEFPDMQEIGAAPLGIGESAAIGSGLLLAPDEERQKAIIRRQVPGVEFSTDRNGNTMVWFPGQSERFYLNKPGLSMQDVTQGAADILKYVPAGRMAAGANTVGGKVLTGGLASGATSLLSDAAAMPLGAQEFDFPQAIAAGLGGGAGEAAFAGLQSLYRTLQAVRGVNNNGTLTERGRALLRENGINVDTIAPELEGRLQQYLARGMEPEQGMRRAYAESLDPPVPLTRGEASGMGYDQLPEDFARKGAFGEAAERTMAGHREARNTALQSNLDRLERELGPEGAAPMPERHMAGPRVQERLTSMESASRARVDQAYESARSAGGGMPTEYGPSFSQNVIQGGAQYFPHSPIAQSEAARLQQLFREAGDNSAVRLQALEDWRRDVTGLANSASDRTEASALRGMRDAYDQEMRHMAANDLMAGDEAAVAAWQEAVGRRREHGRLFESGDLVNEIIDTEYKGGGVRLRHPPEEVSNLLFGASESKLINQPAMVRELRRVRQLLGDDSEAWRSVVQESFMRLASKSRGPQVAGEYGFSGAHLKRRWDDFRNRNPDMARLLFDEDQSRAITQFVNFAANVTNTAAGGQNFSNTATGAARATGYLAQAFGFGPAQTAMLGGLIGLTREPIGALRAGSMVGGRPRYPSATVGGASPGAPVGAAVLGETESTPPTGREAPRGANDLYY